MTFDQIADTIRKAYPTASEVSIVIRSHNMHMTVCVDKPTSFDPVTTLDGKVLIVEHSNDG
jgi:hypothetical protein